VAHRPIWPCAKRTELKTFVHQEFYGTHLGSFGGDSNFTSQKPWISFFHKTPHQAIYLIRATPTNLVMFKTHRTQNIGAPRIYGTNLGHLEVIPTFTSQKPSISFFHKTPHQAIYLSRATPTNLAMFKTHRTQNIRAPRILWYSFGELGGHSNLYISKTMNFIFSQNTPPSHLPKSCHTDQLGHVQNTPNSKYWCTKNFMVLISGTWRPFWPLHLKNHEFHFFRKHPTK